MLARSPRLFAGSCVLHRLLLPRHPPHALCSYSPVRSLGPGLGLRPLQDLENFALGHISQPDRSLGREIDTAFTTIRMRTLKELNALAGEATAGGGDRNRTDDPLRAKQVLSQLSYAPTNVGQTQLVETVDLRPDPTEVVGPG